MQVGACGLLLGEIQQRSHCFHCIIYNDAEFKPSSHLETLCEGAVALLVGCQPGCGLDVVAKSVLCCLTTSATATAAGARQLSADGGQSTPQIGTNPLLLHSAASNPLYSPLGDEEQQVGSTQASNWQCHTTPAQEEARGGDVSCCVSSTLPPPHIDHWHHQQKATYSRSRFMTLRLFMSARAHTQHTAAVSAARILAGDVAGAINLL